MKFEVKTNNDVHNRAYFFVLLVFAIVSFLIILSNISIKLGKISKYYEINYLCRLLIIEKQASNFKRLSKLSNLTTKQKMWDLCREIVK